MESEFDKPPPPPPPPPPPLCTLCTATATTMKPATVEVPPPPPPPEELPHNHGDKGVDGGRGPGVSDEIWRQLQLDKEKSRLQAASEEEERVLKKLREIDVCDWYNWVKQGGGWM